MHSRKDPEPDDSNSFPAEWESDDEGVEESDIDHEIGLDGALADDAQPRSWKRACAARRSIERYQERRRLRAWLTEVFDDDLESELDGYEVPEEPSDG